MHCASIERETVARAFYLALKHYPIGTWVDSYVLWDEATAIWRSWGSNRARPKSPATWLSNVRMELERLAVEEDGEEQLKSRQRGYGAWEYRLVTVPRPSVIAEQLALGV